MRLVSLPARFHNKRLQSTLSERLASDEKTLWTFEGAHVSGDLYFYYWFQVTTMALFLILVFWVGFGRLWIAMVLTGSAFGIVAALFSIYAVLLGAIMPVLSILRSGHFAYAITDKRLIIFNTFPPLMTRDVWPDELEFSSIQEAKGRGTVFLRNVRLFSHYSLFGHWHITWNVMMPRKIMNVSDANTAATHIRALINAREKLTQEAIARDPAVRPKNQGWFKPTDW